MRLGRKAALAVGSGALAAAFGGLAGVSMPAAAVAAVQVAPFADGNVIPLVAGKMAQPPTTAQCEADYGIACYQPFQLQRAYDLAPLFSRGIEGRGETIVIVDAFGSPSIASDLRTFDSDNGLPNPPSFRVITPEGPITTNPSNCTSVYSPTGPDLCSDYYGWTDETSLDVEWSHVMAPKANILLAETPVTETEGIYGFPQIVAAENYVINHHLGDVISQSFGAALAQSGRHDGIVPISRGKNTYTFCLAADVQSNSSCASSSDLVTVPGFHANGSYNDATGWGTVKAASFVPALARFAAIDSPEP